VNVRGPHQHLRFFSSLNVFGSPPPATWTTVWRLLGPKGEAGVGLKKGKQGQLSQELKPGRHAILRIPMWLSDRQRPPPSPSPTQQVEARDME